MASLRPANQLYSGPELDQPPAAAAAVTKTDISTGDATARITVGYWVGTGGNIYIVPAGGDGTPIGFLNVPNGTFIPIRAVRIHSTGTTAADIVALYGVK